MKDRLFMDSNWILFRDCWRLLLLLLLGILSGVQAQQGQGSLNITFTKAPSVISAEKRAVFEFNLRDQNNSDPCSSSSCSIRCKLDQGPFQDCVSRGDSYVNLADGRHIFEVAVNRSNGMQFSTQYSWSIDTVPPTASIVAGTTFTNGFNVTVDILFSEPCNGSGGFSCVDVPSCDLMLRGPGTVLPSTLNVVQPGLEYNLQIALSNATVRGRVVLAMAKDFCSDSAGNKFQRSANSSSIVRFDRSDVFVNVWTPIVDSQVLINNQTRTIQATNKVDDLKIYFDFTEPVVNTTEQLLDSLHTNTGVLQPTRRKSRGNRRFAFLLTNVSGNAVITVSLESTRIVSRAGTAVQPISPVNFIFDGIKPQATLSTTQRAKTKDNMLPILIQFSEPVFQFASSALSVTGGNVSSFREISKSTYFAEISTAGDNVVSVFVPEDKTIDVAGNTNSASNLLRVKHYNGPALSVALYSFTSAGLLATTLASGALSVSSASLAAAGALTSRTVGAIVTDPSRNLVGMAGHLQIFALSDWLAVSLPIEYRETVRGLRWLIPHVKVPWESQHESSANDFVLDSSTPSMVKARWQRNLLSGSRFEAEGLHDGLDCEPVSMQSLDDIRCSSNVVRPERRLGSNASIFGPPLGLDEYQLYFENVSSRPQRSLNDLLKNKYTGWRDFKRNTFWLAVVGGALIILHIATLQFLRWRTKTSLRGALTIPRFELFLLLLSLPCICQASSFIIRGGTTAGIIVGVLLLALPAAFLFSVFLFLMVGVIMGAFVQYNKFIVVNREIPWHEKLLATLAGKKTIGKWVRKEGLSSTFLPRYGLLFEDRKGPPQVVLFDEANGQDVLRWVESGSNGIGRMKAINSDDEHEHAPVSKFQKILGAARTIYILVDVARRATIGIVLGAYPRSDHAASQVLILLAFTVGQLLYLMVCKPYIRRGVQVVETVSLACQAGLFAAALALLYQSHPFDDNKGTGILMLSFLFISFVAQLVNEWYALMGLLVQLAPTQEPSLKLGLKMFGRGLVLPFIPRRKWSRFITPQQQQPKTGLAPVVQYSPSPDFQGPGNIPPTGSPIVVTETGVPYDPGSPSLVDPRFAAAVKGVGKDRTAASGGSKSGLQKQIRNQWGRAFSSEGKKARGSRPDPKTSELKMLRELAKASFPGVKKESPELPPPVVAGPSSGLERGKQRMASSEMQQPEPEDSSENSSNGVMGGGLASAEEHPGSSSKAGQQEAIAGAVLRKASSGRMFFDER